MTYEKPSSVVLAILNRAETLGLTVTPMQLQKLLYFTNGWYVEMNEGRELFLDKFEAWTWGPVIPQIYHQYKLFGKSAIPAPSEKARLNNPGLISLIDAILRIYGNLGGVEMSMLTHKDGTPWSTVWQNGLGKGFDISTDLIFQEFRSIREQPPIAKAV